MKLFKTVILLTGIFLLFAGNIGLDVFKHICQEDGVEMAFVINTIDHCDEHNESLPPCCQDEHKDDCCDNEVTYLQIKLDYFQQINDASLFIVPQQPKPVWFEEVITVRDAYVSYTNTDPPPLDQSTRRSLIQSYII